MDDLTVRLVAHELLLIRAFGALAMKSDDPPRYLASIRDNIRQDIFKPTTDPVSDTDRRKILDLVDHLLSDIRILPERGN